MIERERVVRSSKMDSNFVELLIPRTLMEAIETVFVASSSDGEELRFENLCAVGDECVGELVLILIVLVLLLLLLLIMLLLFRVSIFFIKRSLCFVLSLLGTVELCCGVCKELLGSAIL